MYILLELEVRIHYPPKGWGLQDFFFFFLMFLKVSYAHQACIYLLKKYNKNSNIVKYFNAIQNNCFLFEYNLKCNLFL